MSIAYRGSAGHRRTPGWVQGTATLVAVLMLWGTASAGSLGGLECDHGAHDRSHDDAVAGAMTTALAAVDHTHGSASHMVGEPGDHVSAPGPDAAIEAECGHCPQEGCAFHAACGATTTALRSLRVRPGSAIPGRTYQDAPYVDRRLDNPANLATPPPRIAA